jgi:4'-phosphopantetheinyl transferase
MFGKGLTSGTVHVWTIDLDVEPPTVAWFLDFLSGEERVRSARLRTTELRLRFIVAHGALRAILGCYLGLPGSAVRLETTAAGKPFVPDAPVAFNLSHSDALAACALRAGGQLGVDVERVRSVPDADSIVKRYFAPGEAREYAALPAAERTAAFFSTWTRKEAFVKALGDGMQCPLDSFEVDIAPDVVNPRIAIDAAHGGWHLRSFAPAPGYAGAVASDSEILSLERFTFDRHVLEPAATQT